MNTKLRMQAKSNSEKYFFKLTNNSVFRKTMGNVRNHRDIRVVSTDKRRNKFESQPNYHTTKYISEKLIVIVMKLTEVKMNKPIYLGQSILDISKTLMYEFAMTVLSQSKKIKQDYAIWILIALLLMLKLNIFMKILLMV